MGGKQLLGRPLGRWPFRPVRNPFVMYLALTHEAHQTGRPGASRGAGTPPSGHQAAPFARWVLQTGQFATSSLNTSRALDLKP